MGDPWSEACLPVGREAGLQTSVLTNRNLIQRPIELGKQTHHCKAQRMPKGSIGRSSRYRWKDERPISEIAENITSGNIGREPKAKLSDGEA